MMARPVTALIAAVAIATAATAPLSGAHAHDRGYQHHHAKNWKGHKQHRHAKRYHGKKRYYAKRRYHAKKRYYNGHRRYRGPVVVERYDNNDALLWGVLGLATGAIIAGTVLNSPADQQDYDTAPDRDYYPPAPDGTSYSAGKAGIEPWTDEWFRYCANKYRSFNAATGTYRGYDGYDHFCMVK